jgi:hypothetical protein
MTTLGRDRSPAGGYAAPLARERHQTLGEPRVAPDAGKAVRQDPAAEAGADVLLDPPRDTLGNRAFGRYPSGRHRLNQFRQVGGEIDVPESAIA